MEEVINRLKKAGVKLVQNDGIELTYDQAMTSFHLVNYEFKERLNDYLTVQGLKDKYPTFASLLEHIGSDDVRQLLKALDEHPST